MFDPAFQPSADTSAIVRTPDGRDVSREKNIADLQRRMDMTTRIDTMRTVVDSVTFVRPDSAVVRTYQRFVRWMKLPDQPERQRISSVVHHQAFRKVAGAWRPAGPLVESDLKARWADDPAVPSTPP